jgi:protein SCO1/2
MIFALVVLLASNAYAQILERPALLQNVGIEQKMGAETPLDLAFSDEAGQPATLRNFLGKPVILALVYYQCPSLCNLVLNGVLRSVNDVKLNSGSDYNIVAVSFDPRETPEMAAAKKHTYLQQYNDEDRARREAAGWHFLTGEQEASKSLAKAIGFNYSYDATTNQYVHPSAVMILTPGGRVSRYFYGVEYPPRDMRLALVEASDGGIGTAVDQVLLYCFHYDPAIGKYGIAIMNVLRLTALLTLLALFAFILSSLRKDFRPRGTDRRTV